MEVLETKEGRNMSKDGETPDKNVVEDDEVSSPNPHKKRRKKKRASAISADASPSRSVDTLVDAMNDSLSIGGSGTMEKFLKIKLFSEETTATPAGFVGIHHKSAGFLRVSNADTVLLNVDIGGPLCALQVRIDSMVRFGEASFHSVLRSVLISRNLTGKLSLFRASGDSAVAVAITAISSTTSKSVKSSLHESFVVASLQGRTVFDGALHAVSLYGVPMEFLIHTVLPSRMGPGSKPDDHVQGLTRVTLDTKVTVVFSEGDGAVSLSPVSSTDPEAFSTVAGLGVQIDRLKDLVRSHVIDVEKWQGFKVSPSRGAVLFGPSGTGKSSLLQSFSRAYPFSKVVIDRAWLRSKSDPEELVRSFFRSCHSPALVLIDDLSEFAPCRSEGIRNESRVTSIVCAAIRELERGVFVIAATDRVDNVDPRLLVPGALDLHLEIPVPSVDARSQILEVLLPEAEKEDRNRIAANTHGFVGGDLVLLCRRAIISSLSREGPSYVTLRDLEGAQVRTRPTALREILVDVPKVKWTDIGGQEDAKQRLKEIVEWPLRYPETFERMKVSSPSGVLLYGPPGCSKTMMARALATESGLNFISIKGPELFNKYVGESERSIRLVFERARAAAPCIVFFDEIDALAVARGTERGHGVGDRVLSQLLTELDGVETLTNVIFVAATNRPDILDSALLRPGRIDALLYISPPDRDARLQILRMRLESVPCTDDVSFEALADLSQRYSGAELTSLCREAAMLAMREDVGNPRISLECFRQAMKSVRPRLDPASLRRFVDFQESSALNESLL